MVQIRLKLNNSYEEVKNTNEGWQRTVDDVKQMKLEWWRPLDQVDEKPKPLDLGSLGMTARVWRLKIPTVRCRYGEIYSW